MARPKVSTPSLRYHVSGQSVVTINGKDFYLGIHNRPETLARYAVLIAEYQRNGLCLPAGFELSTLDSRVAEILGNVIPQNQDHGPKTVKHVTACFRALFETPRYANRPEELRRLGQVCDALDEHDGNLLAADYGPLALQRQRQRWVDTGVSRTYANRLTNVIFKIFKFAVSQQVIDGNVWQRLKSVEPLRYGDARETKPVLPVPIEDVRATAKHLSPVLRDMIRVQIATGMRPSEICRMRPCDIDRTGEIWMYRISQHKTARHGIQKAVPLLGDAREAVEDYMNRPKNAFLFSPAESAQWYRAKRHSERTTAASCGNNIGTNRKENPARTPGIRFDLNSYRKAIQRAAKQAGVQSWFPYQLRHLTATVVRSAMGGLDEASALLGHTDIGMTGHYARLSESKAIEAAKVAPKL